MNSGIHEKAFAYLVVHQKASHPVSQRYETLIDFQNSSLAPLGGKFATVIVENFCRVSAKELSKSANI